MKKDSCLLMISLLASASAFVLGPAGSFGVSPPRNPLRCDVVGYKSSSSSNSNPVNGLQSSTTSSTTTSQSAKDFVRDFLEDLATSGSGKKLLDSSSESWRRAIYEAVGAPPTAKEPIVAKALTDAMARPNNQFAILMGKAEDFTMTFPSDPVEYDDDSTSWVEVRLRGAQDDELLVTMGVQLQQRSGDGAWLVSKLDWQDFRDAFYPGLSGREWLRAF